LLYQTLIPNSYCGVWTHHSTGPITMDCWHALSIKGTGS